MRQGQDYFGQYCNYVPTEALVAYKSSLTAMLTLASQVEIQATIYNTQSQTLAKKTAALNASVAHTQSVISHLQKEQTDNFNDIKSVTAHVNQMMKTQEQLAASLSTAQRSFKSAVEYQLANCTFADIVTYVQAVVTIVAGAETGVGEIEGIAKLEGEAATFANYIKKVQKIVKTATDMQKSFTSIKSTITKAMPDASKIPIAEANIDKVIKPYLDLPAAKNYKALMHAFLALVQARNKQVVRLNQLHFNEVALAANLKDRKVTLLQVRAGLAADQSRDLPYFQAHMDALVHDLRLRILAMPYAENQAFHYWAFSDESSMVSSDATLANLAVAQTTVETNITGLVNQKVDPRPPMNDVRITLDASVVKDSFDHFLQSGAMHFALTPDNPAFLNLADMTLTKFRVEIKGAKPSAAANNRIFANLTQHGTSTFITRKNKKITFSRKHRTASYFFFTDSRPASGGQLADQNGDLIQVSPFAAWTLDVSQADNANIDLSAVSSLELIFDGWYT
jgi:hypothetical protein